MIVAVVGGDGTGKSTLSRALAGRTGLSCLEALKSTVLASSGYHTLYEWDAVTGELPALVERQAARETANASMVIDSAACELLALSQRWAWNRLSPHRWERLRAAALEAASRYRTLVIMPARVVAPPATGRFRSVEHNEQLRRLLLALANEAQLPHVLLDDGDEAARLHQIVARLA